MNLTPEFLQPIYEVFADALRRIDRCTSRPLQKLVAAQILTGSIFGFGDTIRVENQNVQILKLDHCLKIVRAWDQSYWQPGNLLRLRIGFLFKPAPGLLGCMIPERRQMAGVGEG